MDKSLKRTLLSLISTGAFSASVYGLNYLGNEILSKQIEIPPSDPSLFCPEFALFLTRSLLKTGVAVSSGVAIYYGYKSYKELFKMDKE
jgi:hypothetical protein